MDSAEESYDRVAIVTGGARGLGRAMVQGLLGNRVAVAAVDRDREPLEELASAVRDRTGFAPLLAITEDLTTAGAAERVGMRVLARFGRIDVLVNNAGVALPVALEGSFEAWQRVWETTLAVNLRAPELLTRYALRHFLAQGGSPGHLRIINVASRAAFRGDTPDFTAYAASKGGLVALTRTIARGYGKQGVRAFTVAPGFTATDMAQDFIDRYGEQVVGDVSLERLTRPEDVAPTIIFLASGHADHATGCTIDVNAASYVH